METVAAYPEEARALRRPGTCSPRRPRPAGDAAPTRPRSSGSNPPSLPCRRGRRCTR